MEIVAVEMKPYMQFWRLIGKWIAVNYRLIIITNKTFSIKGNSSLIIIPFFHFL